LTGEWIRLTGEWIRLTGEWIHFMAAIDWAARLLLA
jgi:hypothetical protein